MSSASIRSVNSPSNLKKSTENTSSSKFPSLKRPLQMVANDVHDPLVEYLQSKRFRPAKPAVSCRRTIPIRFPSGVTDSRMDIIRKIDQSKKQQVAHSHSPGEFSKGSINRPPEPSNSANVPPNVSEKQYQSASSSSDSSSSDSSTDSSSDSSSDSSEESECEAVTVIQQTAAIKSSATSSSALCLKPSTGEIRTAFLGSDGFECEDSRIDTNPAYDNVLMILPIEEPILSEDSSSDESKKQNIAAISVKETQKSRINPKFREFYEKFDDEVTGPENTIKHQKSIKSGDKSNGMLKELLNSRLLCNRMENLGDKLKFDEHKSVQHQVAINKTNHISSAVPDVQQVTGDKLKRSAFNQTFPTISGNYSEPYFPTIQNHSRDANRYREAYSSRVSHIQQSGNPEQRNKFHPEQVKQSLSSAQPKPTRTNDYSSCVPLDLSYGNKSKSSDRSSHQNSRKTSNSADKFQHNEFTGSRSNQYIEQILSSMTKLPRSLSPIRSTVLPTPQPPYSKIELLFGNTQDIVHDEQTYLTKLKATNPDLAKELECYRGKPNDRRNLNTHTKINPSKAAARPSPAHCRSSSVSSDSGNRTLTPSLSEKSGQTHGKYSCDRFTKQKVEYYLHSNTEITEKRRFSNYPSVSPAESSFTVASNSSGPLDSGQQFPLKLKFKRCGNNQWSVTTTSEEGSEGSRSARSISSSGSLHSKSNKSIDGPSKHSKNCGKGKPLRDNIKTAIINKIFKKHAVKL